MFESASLDHRVAKEDFLREQDTLRAALVNAQYDLSQDARFAVLVLIAGVEGAGKSETVNLLNAWMDPRHIRTTAFGPPSDEEQERPPLWRFWRALPPRGRIGIFFGAWHTQPILQRVLGRLDEGGFEAAIADIQRLERMLCDEGVLLLKYWFHLSKAQQRQRLKSLEKDPATRWRVTPTDWDYFKRYDRFVQVCEPFVRETSTAQAPWIVVPGADPHHRALTVGRHLLAALRARLDAPAAAARGTRAAQARAARAGSGHAQAVPLPQPAGALNVLSALQLNQPLARDDYLAQLAHWQGRLALAARHPRFKTLSVVAVFEGNDAAGKGSAIRRVTGALDARGYDIVPVAAPSEEERAQPYLWRFWRPLPRRGRLTLFDRSWYGRVLVERVEGLCPPADWLRAYGEINHFEASLLRHRVVVLKFWLAVSKDEQLRRFKQREQVAFKRFKITPEDWRNRERWDAYVAAVCDMVDHTSTAGAPWTLVEADNKHHARIKVLRTLTERLEQALAEDGDGEHAAGQGLPSGKDPGQGKNPRKKKRKDTAR